MIKGTAFSGIWALTNGAEVPCWELEVPRWEIEAAARKQMQV